MNLRDPEMLKDKSKLPQYRFIFADKEILKLVIRLLFAALSLQNPLKIEKQRTRQMLKAIISSFLGV